MRLTKPQIAALTLAVLFVAGVFAYREIRDAREAERLEDADIAAAVKATTTTIAGEPNVGTGARDHRELEVANWKVGDCLMWGTDADRVSPRIARCTEPHRIEIASRVAIPGEPRAPLPGREEFRRIGTELCPSEIERYLRHPFDRNGRFVLTTITPKEASWALGNRDMWCGIGLRDDAIFTGGATGADQTFLWPVGACITEDGVGVPCEQPHLYEITGEILVADALRPSEDRWSELGSSPACVEAASARLGRPYTPDQPMRSIVVQITEAGWVVGTRRTNCALVRFEGTQSVATSGRAT